MSGLSFGVGSKRGLAPKGSVARKPATVNELFSADSSDEEEHAQAPKRQQTVAVPPALASVPALAVTSRVVVPSDPEVCKAAEKLAEFVAKNGKNFEQITREKNPGTDTPFRFLHDKYSSEYKYYAAKLLEAEIAFGKAPAPGQAAPPPPAPAPGAAQMPPQAQVAAALAAAKAAAMAAAAAAGVSNSSSGGGSNGSAGGPPAPVPGASKAQSLAAMDAYMASLANKDKQREQDELDEQEKRDRANRVILNETSFDRRKVTAVYKEDGRRGHHMGDYIPAEELAKFMAKAGGDSAKATAAAIEARNAIGQDNVGHKLLSKMGWKEGQGIGASQSGITAPVQATGKVNDGLGIGAEAHGEVAEGDDPYEAYRKRMQLGYKYRPNPLGNPRKAYY